MEALGYKYVGQYFTWLVDDEFAETYRNIFPIYAPIEDEE